MKSYAQILDVNYKTYGASSFVTFWTNHCNSERQTYCISSSHLQCAKHPHRMMLAWSSEVAFRNGRLAASLLLVAGITALLGSAVFVLRLICLGTVGGAGRDWKWEISMCLFSLNFVEQRSWGGRSRSLSWTRTLLVSWGAVCVLELPAALHTFFFSRDTALSCSI